MSVKLDSAELRSKAGAARSILRELSLTYSDIEASAVMTRDGYIIDATLDANADEGRFAAMCAALLALAERAASEVSRGHMRQLLIEGTQGLMLLVRAGDDKVLAVAAKPTVNLGRVFLEARRCAEKIDQIIGDLS
jgi:hypothetical protein